MKEQIAASGRIVVQLLAFAALALLVTGCGLEAPQAPSWDTTLTVPLINRSYSSAELLEKLAADNIKIDENGNSTIHIQDQLDTVTIESILAIENSQSTKNWQIGRIKIVSPQDQQQSVAFSDYVTLELGQVPEVGASTTTSFGEASSFTFASIDQATVTLTATNNTGFDLDSLSGRLVNHADGMLLGTFVVPGGLANTANYSLALVLDGKSVGLQVDCEMYFHTFGGPALSLADRSIDLQIHYSDDVYVNSVIGKIDSFTKEYSQGTAIVDNMQIVAAEIGSGNLSLRAQNQLPLNAEVNLEFPEVTKDGQTLQVALTLASQQVSDRVLDLSGWSISGSDDSINAVVTAHIPGSGENYVQVQSGQVIGIELYLENVVLASANGTLAPTDLQFEQIQVAVDVPTGFDNVTLDFVELNITINNYSELSGDVVLDLSASNGKTLQVEGTISGRSGNSVAINQIYSDQLADFFTPLPDEISVAGTATVGDGITTIDLNSSDYFSATAVISAPMAFRISQATIEGDKNELTVDSDISDDADRLNSGVFRASITNHLPLGMQMRMYIGTDSASLFTAPLTIIGPVSFAAATTDGNGTVNQEITTESEVALGADELRVFENSRLFVAPVIELAGSNGQTVRIRASDYFTINGVIEITARVGGEE